VGDSGFSAQSRRVYTTRMGITEQTSPRLGRRYRWNDLVVLLHWPYDRAEGFRLSAATRRGPAAAIVWPRPIVWGFSERRYWPSVLVAQRAPASKGGVTFC